MSPAMSTPETPDAAPGADAPSDETDPVGLTPPLPTVAASDAAATSPFAADDLVPPAPSAAATAVLPPPFVDTRPPAWEAPASAPERTAPSASVDLTGPRVRWAGIVWGLVLAAIAAVALWILLDPARQAALTSWLLDLSPATAIAIAVLLLGMFALITGVVGIARRAQHGIERRRTASSPARI